MAQCHHSDKVKNKSAGTFYGSSKANNGNNFFHFTSKTFDHKKHFLQVLTIWAENQH